MTDASPRDDTPSEPGDDTPAGQVSTLPDGTILSVNRTFLDWTGHEERALLEGRRLQDLLTPAARVFHDLRYLPTLLLAGTVEEMDIDLLRADGTHLAALASARLLRGAGGEPQRVLLVFTRVEGRRQYEAELLLARQRAEAAEAELRRALDTVRAADAAKTRFLSAMQHEFRTPIGLIMGYGDLLAQDIVDAQQREYLAAINDAADQLLRLVDDAALYTEVFATNGPLQLEPVRIELVVRQAAQLAAGRLADAGVQIAMATGPELQACMEPKLMREGLASLMRELANRLSAGVTVKMSWKQLDAGLDLILCCAGLSLPDDVVARLADPLSAVGLHGRSLEGAGLGVAIASRVMSLHQGKLGVETFKGGTRFRLTLPHRRPGQRSLAGAAAS